MWERILILGIVSVSTWFFLLSVSITIKFVRELIVHKITTAGLMNELLIKYGICWAVTLMGILCF